MRLTNEQVKAQYNRAKRNGWLEYFAEAVEKHLDGLFDVADLMAVASRESNLDPKWLTKAGDNGNGFGLMQVDKRSFKKFTESGNWKDARLGILFGAKVLREKWDDTQDCIGERRSVRSSKTGKRHYFTGADVGVTGRQAQAVAIAAYNCGRWAHYAVSNGKDVDTYTTGKDYSKDVMGRAAAFRALLKADGLYQVAAKAAEPSPEPEKDNVPVPEEPVVEVAAPPPYRGVGFWASIKKDLAAAGVGNFGFGSVKEYAEAASGWPEWIIGIAQIAAYGLLTVTFGYFAFRVIHYAVDRWQYWFSAQTEAKIAADPSLNNVKFVAHDSGAK